MENQKKLTTSRGLLLYILFSIITFGIYPLVALSLISNEVNKVCKDGKRTMQFWIVFLLSPFALGIPLLVWWHRICNRIGNELIIRNINYSFSAMSFWGWHILGSLLFGIGPLVFIHKFLKASNKINSDYNDNAISNSVIIKKSAANSVAALVLGITSIVFAYGFIGIAFGILGLILANEGLAQYKKDPSSYSSTSMLNAGRIVSIIGIILSSIVFVAILFIRFA